MNRLSKSGPYIVAIFSLIPLYFWYPFASFADLATTLVSLGQAAALVGTALICINFVLSARYLWVESLFSGLNRVFIIHAYVGAIGFILILLHPAAILLGYLNTSVDAVKSLLIPIGGNLGVYWGMATLFVLTLLITLTLYIKMDYDLWKKTHQYMGLVLLLAVFHVTQVESTISISPPLGIYIYGLFIAGAVSFLYKLFSRPLGIHRHHFTLEGITVQKEATILTLKPQTTMFSFVPGQFAFISARNSPVPRDAHPFSITSSPNNSLLSFAAKPLGDYTQILKQLVPGTPIEVEGPFGRFSYHYYKNPNQLWIAGGIGITPFMSMLRSLPTTHIYSVTFVYCVKDRSELLFIQELQNLQTTLPNIKLEIWASNELGRLTADGLAGLVTGLAKHEVFICGPPAMMHALRKQLIKKQIRNSRIHTEEFSLSN